MIKIFLCPFFMGTRIIKNNIMKIKKVLALLFISSLLVACGQKGKEIERVSNIRYSVLTDSVYTRLPGELLYQGEYVVWIDPFTTENFVHVLDAETGAEMLSFGNIGEGPTEFNMANASLTHTGDLLLYDLNKKLQAVVVLKDAIADSSKLYNRWESKDLGTATRYCEFDTNSFLTFCPEGNFPFVINKINQVDSVGKYPLSEKINNQYDVYQGEVFYNSDKNALIYSTYYLPYLSMYSLENDTLVQQWEQKEGMDYSINNGKLVLGTNNREGFSAITLSKDYIIGVKRDEAIEGKMPEAIAQRDLNQLPRSLFLYDYNAELMKIVNLDLPILRIASDIHSNTVYLMVANPDYCIIKIEV